MKMTAFRPEDVAVPRGHLIGGRVHEGGAAAIEVRRPSDGLKHGSVPHATSVEVDAAVRAAAGAFDAWRGHAPRERGRILRRWAELVEAHAEELARLEAVVSARPATEARAVDVPGVAEWLRYYGEFADKLDGAVTPTSPERLSLVLREPYGVVGVITPWNFPLFLAAWKIAPALAAGNTVVLKPSELTPWSIQRVAALGLEAGLPPGALNILHGDGPGTGAALVRHPGVAYVSFTGSTAVGARIMADAAAHGIKPVSLELGGKHPQVVFADCGDLDEVAQHVAWGITRNAGQICSAGSRLVVEKGVEEALVEKVAARMRALAPTPTWAEVPSLAPIISEKQLARMERLVRQTVEEGATLVCGGRRTGGEGWFFEPTILRGVGESMAGFREEIFGPVLSVETFEGVDEAVARATHPLYGLTASVFTRDINKALTVAKRLPTGSVWVNRWGLMREMMTSPFGGIRQSGFGKDSGREGIEKYLRSKAVWIEHGMAT
jgi:aldehyde dehydrogenase (NAD+)